MPARRPRRTSLREALPSFGTSFIVHAVLFLIPLSWFFSASRTAKEPSLLVTNLETKPAQLATFLDAPREVPAVKIAPVPTKAPVVSSLEEEPKWKGPSLPSLRSPQSGDPNSRPKSVAEIDRENSGTVDQKLETEIQKRVDREAGKSGPVQISLMWNNGNDVDLYVQTPVGDIIAFNYKKSRCGGELDVDMNAKKPESLKPVENVFWSKKQAPLGVFVVGVHEYQNHGFRDPTPFLVSVKIDGKVRHFRGKIRRGDAVLGACKFRRTKQGAIFLETPATIEGNRSGKPVFK